MESVIHLFYPTNNYTLPQFDSFFIIDSFQLQSLKHKSRMKRAILIFIAFSLISLAQSTLSVYMNACAKGEITKDITYTLANFGHIPYGRTIIGQLIIPQTNQFFCQNTEDFPAFANLKQENIRRVVLVKRGNCKFTKKILNAQKKGADMVIVYNNQPSTEANVVMSNDGHGHLIDIPSLFISSTDGENLIKTYKKCEKSVILKASYDVFVSPIANLTFWLDVNNRESFITIRDFYRDYYSVLEKHVNFDVRFKINKYCGMEVCLPEDCIKNGNEYCLHTEKTAGGLKVQGKELVSQHLRSYYLFNSMKQKKSVKNWFQYMVQFDQNLCIEKLDMRSCSLEIIKKYESTDAIEGKVNEALTAAKDGKPNTVQSFYDDSYKSDILFYPEASINGRNYYGLFKAPDIFRMVCQSLERPPRECRTFTKVDQISLPGSNQSEGVWKVVLLIIFGAIVVFFAALFIYNRLIRKQLNQQMSLEVNKMVEHYVSMTDTKHKTNESM